MEELDEEQRALAGEFLKRESGANLAIALKFLRGRKFDLNRAINTYHSYLKAVKENNLENITIEDVEEELRSMKMYVPGPTALNDSIIFVVNASRHNPKEFPKGKTLALAFFLSEYAISNPATQSNGITIISNLKNVKLANFDNDFQRMVIGFFSNNVPVSVKNILVYDPPWIINAIIKVVSPFLKQKIRDRIVVTKDLTQFVNLNALPEDLGGNFPFDIDAFIQYQKKLLSISKMEEIREEKKAEHDMEKFNEKLSQLNEPVISLKKPEIEEKEPVEMAPEPAKKQQEKSESKASKSFVSRLTGDLFSKKEKPKEEKQSESIAFASTSLDQIDDEYSQFLEELDIKIKAREITLAALESEPADYDKLRMLPDWTIIRRPTTSKRPSFVILKNNEQLEDFKKRLDNSFESDYVKKKKNRNVLMSDLEDSIAGLSLDQRRKSLQIRRQSIREHLASVPTYPK